MPFVIIPASQVAQKPKKKVQLQSRGRSLGSSPNQKAAQQKSTASGSSRTTVTVAAYGGKLFEPIMAREKPIYVHFKDFIIRDDDAITRFSEDGWFAIKFFLSKDDEGRSRCYLVYFINPINATSDYSLMQACIEAIEYKVYEFFDEREYVDAARRKDKEGLCPQDAIRLRSLSALGQAEQMIIKVLRDKITAEKFLKRQKEYEKQNLVWRQELQRLREEEDDDELENSNDVADSESNISKSDDLQNKAQEDSEVLTEEGQEVSGDKLSEQKAEPRIEAEAKPQPKPFVWGGGRK